MANDRRPSSLRLAQQEMFLSGPSSPGGHHSPARPHQEGIIHRPALIHRHPPSLRFAQQEAFLSGPSFPGGHPSPGRPRQDGIHRRFGHSKECGNSNKVFATLGISGTHHAANQKKHLRAGGASGIRKCRKSMSGSAIWGASLYPCVHARVCAKG